MAPGQVARPLERLGGVVPALDLEAVLGEEHRVAPGAAGQVERERRARGERARSGAVPAAGRSGAAPPRGRARGATGVRRGRGRRGRRRARRAARRATTPRSSPSPRSWPRPPPPRRVLRHHEDRGVARGQLGAPREEFGVGDVTAPREVPAGERLRLARVQHGERLCARLRGLRIDGFHRAIHRMPGPRPQARARPAGCAAVARTIPAAPLTAPARAGILRAAGTVTTPLKRISSLILLLLLLAGIAGAASDPASPSRAREQAAALYQRSLGWLARNTVETRRQAVQRAGGGHAPRSRQRHLRTRAGPGLLRERVPEERAPALRAGDADPARGRGRAPGPGARLAAGLAQVPRPPLARPRGGAARDGGPARLREHGRLAGAGAAAGRAGRPRGRLAGRLPRAALRSRTVRGPSRRGARAVPERDGARGRQRLPRHHPAARAARCASATRTSARSRPSRTRPSSATCRARSRAAFIERFWQENDPDLTTPENEARLEYWARVTQAYFLFFDAKRGGWDERGEVFVRYGPPAEMQYNPVGREAELGLRHRSGVPGEPAGVELPGAGHARDPAGPAALRALPAAGVALFGPGPAARSRLAGEVRGRARHARRARRVPPASARHEAAAARGPGGPLRGQRRSARARAVRGARRAGRQRLGRLGRARLGAGGAGARLAPARALGVRGRDPARRRLRGRPRARSLRRQRDGARRRGPPRHPARAGRARGRAAESSR